MELAPNPPPILTPTPTNHTPSNWQASSGGEKQLLSPALYALRELLKALFGGPEGALFAEQTALGFSASASRPGVVGLHPPQVPGSRETLLGM